MESSVRNPARGNRLIAVAGAVYALLVGSLTLLGYALDLPSLTDWSNDDISMFPNAAASAALGGLALILLATTQERRPSRIAVRVIASAVGLVGGLTLFEHLSGLNLGIDTMLFQRSWGQAAAAAPMRIGPPASTSYLLIGTGLLLSTFGQRARSLASALGIVVVSIASLSLIGYWFGSEQFFAGHLTGIAFQTSTVVAAIGVGLIASMPEHGLAAILRRDDPGGVIVRRLIVPIIVIPLALGWLRVLGEGAGYFDTAFGTAAMALLMILMLSALLWWTAAGVSRQSQRIVAAEQAARDSEARQRALLDASVYGVLTINEHGIIESANPAVEQLFGYARSELIGRNVSMLMPQPYQSEHDSYLENYRRTGVRKIIGIGREVAGRRKDGSTFPMDLAVAEFQLGGKRYFQGMVHDISERKGAEKALREADRRKNEFLATLAHELRNPLAPIRNAIRLLMEKGSPDPDFKWVQEVIERQVKHMARLLDDLLDVSRITHNKLALRKERVDLAAVIKGAVETSRPLIDSNGQELAVTLPPPVYLEGDSVRLAQVFSNLLNNAAKYSERGGKIRLACTQQEGSVVVSVKDDGMGITEEMLPRIFDIFAQTEHAMARSRGGLGIGLSLVRKMVEIHGGSVEAYSDGPGKGSEFIVRLPVAMPAVSQEPAATHTSAEQEGRAGKCRVLVVDDLRDNADSLAMLLKMVGHEVHTAYDGEEAVLAAEQFQPDVVLLDIGMPKQTGYEAIRSIRGQSWGERMCFVAMTGWGKEEDRRRTKDAGFNFHMVKPVDPTELMRLLDSLHAEHATPLTNA